MDAVVTSLECLLNAHGAPGDEWGLLAQIGASLAELEPVQLFLIDDAGALVATHPAAPDLAALIGHARDLAALFTDVTGGVRCRATTDDLTLVGLAPERETSERCLLGVLTRMKRPQGDLLAGVARWEPLLAGLCSAAGRMMVELREAAARMRQLRGEQRTLRTAHDDTIRSMLEEREARLQEKRHYILLLEEEVRKRSTALREALERAEQASRTKSEFLANMSHEIRTPMTAIIGFAEQLEDPDIAPAERAAAIQTIRRNGQHLLELINDILDLSKIEAGKLAVECIPVAPGRAVREVMDLMRGRAEGKQLRLTAEFDGPLPEAIETDATRLRQILINLISNAIKFTDQGGITLTTALVPNHPAGPMLSFQVTDTGIGMSAEQVAQLFRPFTQADASTTRRYGGTGLGLSISKRLAAQLGGDLTVSSAPALGSTFTLLLPTGPLADVRLIDEPSLALFNEDRAPLSTPARDTAAFRFRRPARILFAEDGPDNQRLISFLLKRAGASVDVVPDGRLAVQRALHAWQEERPYDVILMDMQMPELDGYGATRELRAAGYALPIIAVTGNAMAGDCERCIEAGCNAFASKPIDRAGLLRLVDRFLDPRADQPAGPASHASQIR